MLHRLIAILLVRHGYLIHKLLCRLTQAGEFGIVRLLRQYLKQLMILYGMVWA